MVSFVNSCISFISNNSFKIYFLGGLIMNGTNGDDIIDESGASGSVNINARRGDDTVIGSAFADVLHGQQGDDFFRGNGGDDTIFGHSGFDTAAFNGSIFDFSWEFQGNSIFVTDLNTADGDDGTAKLKFIEALQYDDYLLFVDGTNNAPLISAGNQTTDEDTPTTFTIDAFDFDGDTMTIDSVVYNGLGSLTLNSVDATGDLNANFTFDPGSAFQSLGVGDEATETATITVSDGNGGVTTQSFDIVITGVNDDPTAVAGAASGDEDTLISGSLIATDIDGDSLTFALDTDATNGGVVVNTDGTFDYTPDANFNGSDSFTYIVSDGNGGTDTETVTITVDPVNDDPVASAGMALGDEDTMINGALVASDIDGDTLTFALDTDASNGAVVVQPNGIYTYTPDANFNGNDSFTYTVSDGNGGVDTETVAITVNAVNDDPDAVAGTASGDEDTVINGSLVATDVDGDDLDFALDTGATNGEAIVNPDGTYTYTPNVNFFGSDSFTYTASDGNGGVDTETVTITVNSVNDAPELTPVGDP
jgi:VCBS repeat-containing protein